jgi:hypothetical protein
LCSRSLAPRQLEAQAHIAEETCVCALCTVPLKEPAERFEIEQQTTGHLVGSQRSDHMLIHRQDIAQAAIEWSLLVKNGQMTAGPLQQSFSLSRNALHR